MILEIDQDLYSDLELSESIASWENGGKFLSLRQCKSWRILNHQGDKWELVLCW